MMRDCPDGAIRDLLPDFVHETLPEAERVRLARHLAGCADCAAEVELIRSARAAFDALAPAVDVARIAASLPGAPSPSRRGGARLAPWRIAAAIALVALGGLSVALLRGVFGGVSDGARATVRGVAAIRRAGPDSGPGAKQVPLTPRGREVAATRPEDGVSFGGGFSDLSDDQLKTLLHEIDVLQATPSPEPEVQTTPIIPSHEGGYNAW
jgi:anti-sigma factor RsiW